VRIRVSQCLNKGCNKDHSTNIRIDIAWSRVHVSAGGGVTHSQKYLNFLGILYLPNFSFNLEVLILNLTISIYVL
jgi:hypothetical protein